jgi:predicted TIM-barrel fold metal-dependent hydrolase
MKIIDAHMHITQWLRDDGQCVFDLINEHCQKNNVSYVDNMCCSNNGNLWAGYEMDQSILGAISKFENDKVFTHGCLYIPEDESLIKQFNFKSQLEELMELGLDGVKICDFKPDAYNVLNVEKHLDEYEDYISYCEKYGVHMCWHIADPDFFWDKDKIPQNFKNKGWCYSDNKYVSYDKLITYAYDLIKRHPKLHVLLAHAFFKSNEPKEVDALLKNNPNVCIDLAPGSEMFDGFRKNYDDWYSIFRKHSNRFLFATDGTGSNLERITTLTNNVLRFLQTDDEFNFNTLYVAKGIKLENEYLENILHKNHEREVGLTPKQVNKNALKKYIIRYLPFMKDSKNKRIIEEYYKKNLI